MKKYIFIFCSLLLFAGCVHNSPQKGISSIQVYFTTTKDNPDLKDCGKTAPVLREVPQEKNKIELALQELFLGPTPEEKLAGYQPHWITKDTASYLKSIKVENGIAFVDWKDIRQVVPNASTSCGSATFLSSIDMTLKQFPEVKSVVHSIENNSQIFYEWMQMVCPEEAKNCI